jgi:outer membrane protein OmpA-like peptidoglycan-associated protein
MIPKRPASERCEKWSGVSSYVLLLSAALVAFLWPVANAQEKKAPEQTAQSSCESCHVGIEPMHANVPIDCVTCHGGNDKLMVKEQAHVQPRKGSPFANDTRPIDSYAMLNLEPPAFVQFLNPSDLRIADKTCGQCHADQVNTVRRSIMSTNAMAHNAVFYNNGSIDSKIPIYGEGFDANGHPAAMFSNPPPTREAQDRGALIQLHPHPNFDVTKIKDPLRVAEVDNPELGDRGPGTGGRIAAVFLNVLKTRLNDPTLWFMGNDRTGGDYRASGCSACHVIYANTRDETAGIYAKYGHGGTSYSEDKNVQGKVGFPIVHQFTRQIPSQQCLVCHYHQGNGSLDTYVGAIWWDRESDADLVKKYQGEPDYGKGQPSIWDHNSEYKQTQFEDYHSHGWNIMKVFKRDEKGHLLDADDRVVPENDPDKFKKAVHLKDIHFEKGMECVDCHTSQDMHGDGNLYAQMTDEIEIRCQDCHGTYTAAATLITSGEGKSGGHKLTDATTPFGGPQYEIKDGSVIQHSMTRENVQWVVKQVVDTLNPLSPQYNAKAAYAKLVLRNGSMGSGSSEEGNLAHGNSKVECFSCHSSWQTTCSGCHLPLDINVKSRDLHYDPKFSRAYAPYNQQAIRTDLYFFGISTYNQGSKVWPLRPASSTIVSVLDGDRNNVVHEQPLVSTPGFANSAMTPYPPHTVRTRETKTCTDCHLSTDNNNNARIGSMLGFGVNALNYQGSFAYTAVNGKGITAVQVAEGDEPVPVIGSNFDHILLPESFDKFVKGGRKLDVSHTRRAPKIVSVVVRGEYAISAEGSDGFRLYDIANINNKQDAQRIVQHVNSPLGEGSVVKSPDATSIYLPSSLPMALGRRTLSQNHEAPIHEIFRYALGTDRKDGLLLIDVNTLTDQDPEDNYLLARVHFNPDGRLSGAMAAKTWGHYAYVVSESTGLNVVDLDNPLQPRFVYESPAGTLDGARAIEIQLRYAFVLDRGGMKVFDITNPEQPVFVPGGTVPMPDARGFTLFRSTAIVAAGKQGLAIVDVANPENPGAPTFYTAEGKINDAFDVTVAETNVSYFAYVADGRNGMQIVALVQPDDTPGYQSFAPDLTPKLIASFSGGGNTVAVARGQVRDRFVDESGNQIDIDNRMGSRPFNREEIRRILFYPDGRLLKVSNQLPPAPPKPPEPVAQPAPAPEAPPPEVKELETRLALHSIYFPTAQPTERNPRGGLMESQEEVLTALASDFTRYLTFKPDAHLILGGHADVRGSVEYNKALTERRVERAKSFLVDHGVPPDSIEVQAFGKEDELTAGQVKDEMQDDPDLNPDERQKMLNNLDTIVLANNRRLDVTLSTSGQQSVRRYPFNAKDALTLISPKGGEREPAAKKKPKKQ